MWAVSHSVVRRVTPTRLLPLTTRTFTDRPSGPGGKSKTSSRIIPSPTCLSVPSAATLTARASPIPIRRHEPGLFRASESINPTRRAQKQTKLRLSRVRSDIEARKIPSEIKDADDKHENQFESEEDIRDFVEARILESMRTGQFDNLKNKGRPLPEQPLSTHDYAMRIMRENGIKPYWLQLMHDIDTEKRLVRANLQHAWHSYMPDYPHRWTMALKVAELRMIHVNKCVDDFNLMRPMSVAHLFRLRLRMNEEIERAMQSPPPNTEQNHDIQEEQPKKEKEEPRPSWQLFARFVRANEVREYERPTWGRRRKNSQDDTSSKDKRHH